MLRHLSVTALVFAAATFAHATWWDAMPLKWTEPPLVQSLQAEDLKGVIGGDVVADAEAQGGKALKLAPGASFPWSFKGPHSHYRFVAIVRVEGAEEEPAKTACDPMFCRVTLTGPTGEVQSWRVMFGYRGVYTNSIDVYMPCHIDGAYSLRVEMGKENAHPALVDLVEIRDLFGACVRKPLKTARRLLADEQVAEMRKQFAASKAKLYQDRGIKRWAEMTHEERRKLFDDIWLAAPPRNSLSTPSADQRGIRNTMYRDPWGLLRGNDRVYSREDFRAGKPLPTEPADTGWGFIDDKGNRKTYLGSLNSSWWNSVGIRYLKLYSKQYLESGDEESGWLGAMLLAALADRWCDLDAGVCGAKIFNGSGRFQHTWRPGKLGHNFWDLGHCEEFNEAYDALFPVIKGNQLLADMLHRHVPWIETPDDVVEYFDVQLVQHTYDLMQRGVVGSGGRIAKAKIRCATILGPSAVSEEIMHGVFTYLRSDLAGFFGGLQQQLWCDHNRDGSSHTNGAGYAKGQAASVFEIASLTQDYAKISGNGDYDLMDTARYPFIKAALYFPMTYRCAGGFVPGIGDWGRPWRPREFTYDKDNDGPVFRKMYAEGWKLTGDPQFAHMLVKGYGRLDETEGEWAALTAAVDKYPRHPVLSQPSRVFPGYGLVYLEDGVRFDDFRKKTAALLRVGYAVGHGHGDTLNLDLYAKGLRVAPDMGSRQGKPNPRVSRQHCLVEVDGHSWGSMEITGSATAGTSWATAFHPVPGVQYTAGEGRSQVHPQVSRYARQVALIGTEDPGAAYVFDVTRVRGGKQHTWCFHGQAIDDGGEFTVNAEMSDKLGPEARAYAIGYNQTEGTAGEAVIAEWRMGNKWLRVLPRADGGEPVAPTSIRAKLFSHAGDKLMTADCDPKHPYYGCLMRFFYVQRKAEEEGLSTVWPAVYETVQGARPLSSIERIDLRAKDDDAAPVAIAVTTAQGRKDLCYADRVGGKPRYVNGVGVSGEFAYWSEDNDGSFRKAMVVGGSVVGKGNVGLQIGPAEYRARVVAIDYAKRTLTLDQPWPSVLSGEHVCVERRGPNHISYQLEKVDGKTVTFVGSPRVYQSFAKRIDDAGFIVPEIDPPLLRADDRFYDGMHLGGADGKAPWRIKSITARNRTMYLGWPGYNRWKQKMTWDDVTDANGDGKRTLILTKKDGQTSVLEVTYVSPDGYHFDFAMPDDPELQGGGWAYVLRKAANEAGTKTWYLLYAGMGNEITLDGAKPTTEALAGKDGRAELNIYDLGVGDQLVVASRAALTRTGDGLYELRANAGVALRLPVGGQAYVRVPGGTWKSILSPAAVADPPLDIHAEELGDGVLQIAATEEATKRAPAAPEQF